MSFTLADGETLRHPLEFGVISDGRMTFVSVAAHERGDLAPMRRMFAEITDPDRVNALEVAQQAIERFRPVRVPHVTAWDGIYMATTETGQDYSGVFSGAAGPNFMMQLDDGAIIIGNVIDLPEPRPESGARISFTTSDPRQLQPAHEQAKTPLIVAVTEWPQSVEEAVLRPESPPDLRCRPRTAALRPPFKRSGRTRKQSLPSSATASMSSVGL